MSCRSLLLMYTTILRGVSSLSFFPYTTLFRSGVTSFKLFTAYPGVLMVDDGALFRAMRVAAAGGGHPHRPEQRAVVHHQHSRIGGEQLEAGHARSEERRVGKEGQRRNAAEYCSVHQKQRATRHASLNAL